MAKNASILLVDDDPDILEVYSEILRQEGYEVLQAATSEEGLRQVYSKRPELVLLDAHLPDGDGLEVCRLLKQDASLSDVCVAIISGEAVGSSDKLRGADLGADDYITKPIYREELLARVHTLLRLRNTTAALRSSEQYYRSLLAILPDAVMLMNLQGRLLNVNPRAVTMFGWPSAEELQQCSLFELVQQREENRLRASIAALAACGEVLPAEYTFIRRSGEQFPVELSAAALQTERGHVLTIVAVLRDVTQQKSAQQQIRLLADAVQSTQELVCVTDALNRFTFVNHAFLSAYGHEEKEVLGRTPDFLYAKSNPAGLCEKIFQQTLRGGWTGELINRRKDGTEFPLALSTSAILNPEGEPIALVGVGRDIGESKRAEKERAALTDLGYRLSGASTALQAAEIILEIASELFGWDAGYVHLYSEATDQILPILTLDTIEGKRMRVENEAIGGVPTPLMKLVMTKGGVLVDRKRQGGPPAASVPFGNKERLSGSMLYAPMHSGRQVVGILSVQSYAVGAYENHDLTLLEALADHCGDALERIKMTDALREAETQLREVVENDRRLTKAILDNISDPAWLKDSQGRFLACNDAFAKLVDREPAQILSRTAKDLHWQLASADVEAIQTRNSIRFEHQQTDATGRLRWFETITSPLMAEDGEVTGTVGIARDITMRKILEEELRRLPRRIMEAQEAERLRVSRELHDGVNQLLASTQMRLRRVQDSLPDRPAAREILSRCHDLLAQALEGNRRIAHDLRPSELDQLGLATACRHLVNELKRRAKFTLQSRITELPERLDPELELNLFRIFQEALNNVEKHSGAGKVVLSLTTKRGQIVLQVKDDGRGFEPIRSEAPGHRSHGIGLTNMAERAAAVGGSCDIVTSTQAGTVVSVRVPLKARPRKPQKNARV